MTTAERKTDEQEHSRPDIHELHTDEGDLSLYAKGHWGTKEFADAARQYLENEYDDYYVWPSSSEVHWGWARFVPDSEWGQQFWVVGHKVTSSRGVFPYTIIEEVMRND